MSQEFQQERKKISPEEFAQRIAAFNEVDEDESTPTGKQSGLENVQSFQKALAEETGKSFSETPMGNPSALKMQGKPPQEFLNMINKNPQKEEAPRQMASKPRDMGMSGMSGSNELEELLSRLANTTLHYDEIELPSKGKFYKNIPAVLHIRPMTGQEEQILATQRLVKKGQAIDKIFANCLQEKIPVEELLTIDRTYMLIFLRGISYTPEYDVEIKCPECSHKFSTVINLDELEVVECPQNFGLSSLEGILPSSGFSYSYRLATGNDEFEVGKHRDRKLNMFDQSEDDTLIYRTAVLLNRIENVTSRSDLEFLLKKLPINDVVHLRNEINTPPFGVKTEVDVMCAACSAEFQIDLPLEANFFFPRKREKTPQ